MRLGMLAGLVVLGLGLAAQAAPVTPVDPGPTQDGAVVQVAAAYNPTVAAVQQQLALQGYYRGAVDGIEGPRTRAAVRAYEADHGLAVTGDVYALASVLGTQTATVVAPVVVQRPMVVGPPPVVYPVRPLVRLFVGPRIGWGFRPGGWGHRPGPGPWR
jgi:peptidoglycan hydrolase-like protein with peptidoglycan-binding domain